MVKGLLLTKYFQLKLKIIHNYDDGYTVVSSQLVTGFCKTRTQLNEHD